jgi:hypothetical protein
MKAGRTMVACVVGKGISLVLKRWLVGAIAGHQGAALWFCPFCRAKAMCGKGSIFAVLIFVTFSSRKK